MRRFAARIFSLNPSRFARPAAEAEAQALSAAKVVVFGEIHSMPPCVELQRKTADALLAASDGRLHVILEHCNFEQQTLLDSYTSGSLSLAQLISEYEKGDEGHDLAAYEPLLSLAQENPSRVALHAGFIPRSYARIVMRESLSAALDAAKAKGFVAADETCEATDAHYSFFESLLTGRSVHSADPPTGTFRKMFPAQVIKDAAMAHYANRLLAQQSNDDDDRYLVVCGVGHSGYSHGVPERILAKHPQLNEAGRLHRVWSLPAPPDLVDLGDEEAVGALLVDAFGPAGTSDPADICMVFKEEEEVDAKEATTAAYNRVGESAHLPGDARRAVALLRRMGYTEAEVAAAGADVANWQGVGCPHRHAALMPGEHVLDLGCGLGVDSFIASAAVAGGGGGGRVVGVDLARREVEHASTRAEARGLNNVASFCVGDLERLQLDGSDLFDVIISNGAFCLAGDKPAAFREAYRVLKPGGRFAICLSVLKALDKGLDASKQWPLCMRMFTPVDELKPACEAAGFVDVAIDDSDSLMAFEVEEPQDVPHEPPQPQSEQRARNRVHGARAKEFEHLQEVDVNELCARVVVMGVKPST